METSKENYARVKAWKEKNKEKVAAQHKRYREKHKDDLKEYNKEYYQNNKEKIDERNKKYAEKRAEREGVSKSYYSSLYRKKRVERLRTEGCTNAWMVIHHKAEPKFNKG